MSTLLTLREVAARLRISRATMARLIATGEIPVVVLAQRQRRRLLRISEQTLERYLGRSTDGTTGAAT